MSGAAEIVSQVRISDVYSALTGAVPRRTGRDTWRGPAPWRGGDSLDSVSGDDGRAVWYDFVTDAGGGVLDLVQRIRGGNRADALRWVAGLAGTTLGSKTPSAQDRARWTRERAEAERIRREARYFAMAAGVMAEAALESLPPDDPERAVHIAMLAALRVSPEPEYRAWLDSQPHWAAALVRAGREQERRLQVLLAQWIADAMAGVADAA